MGLFSASDLDIGQARAEFPELISEDSVLAAFRVSGQAHPIETKVSRKSNPRAIQQIMAERVLGRG